MQIELVFKITFSQDYPFENGQENKETQPKT